MGEDGEAYKTMENLSTQELMLKDMELHNSIHLAGLSAVMGNKATKLECPTIKDQCSDADWDHLSSNGLDTRD